MDIRRKISKVIYYAKSLNNKKYFKLFFIGAAILLFTNLMSSFDMSAKLKQNLSGSGANVPQVNIAKTTIENGVQLIRIIADNNGYTPNAIYVQKGIPVKLVCEGNQLNSCNNGIVLPALNIEKDLKLGENIVEFTPKDEDIEFSCWMGMIKGVIKVTDNFDSVNESKEF